MVKSDPYCGKRDISMRRSGYLVKSFKKTSETSQIVRNGRNPFKD